MLYDWEACLQIHGITRVRALGCNRNPQGERNLGPAGTVTRAGGAAVRFAGARAPVAGLVPSPTTFSEHRSGGSKNNTHDDVVRV